MDPIEVHNGVVVAKVPEMDDSSEDVSTFDGEIPTKRGVHDEKDGDWIDLDAHKRMKEIHILKNRPDGWFKSIFQLKFNPVVTVASTIIIWVFIVLCMTEVLDKDMLGGARGDISAKFTWLYVGTQQIWAFFIFILFFSKYGNLKLGKDDEKPEYDVASWFMMLFAAGVGVGLFYYGVAEPVGHYKRASSDNSRYMHLPSDERAKHALNLAFYHWGIHAWVVYCIVGVTLALMAYRKDLPLTMRSCFYPLLGAKAMGPFGDIIDCLSSICTIFGVCTSLGLGVMDLSGGIARLTGCPSMSEVACNAETNCFWKDKGQCVSAWTMCGAFKDQTTCTNNYADFGCKWGESTTRNTGATYCFPESEKIIGFDNEDKNMLVILVWVITAVATLSAITGMKVGVKLLSIVTFCMGVFLMLYVCFSGHTWFYLDSFVLQCGFYVQTFLELGAHTDAYPRHLPQPPVPCPVDQFQKFFKNDNDQTKTCEFCLGGGPTTELPRGFVFNWNDGAPTTECLPRKQCEDGNLNCTFEYNECQGIAPDSKVDFCCTEDVKYFHPSKCQLANPSKPDEDWMNDWTMFYWGWWISWSPFVGMFIAKISRGRTIREFISGALTAPTLYGFFWFCIFGGEGIRMERMAEFIGLTAEQSPAYLKTDPETGFPLKSLISCKYGEDHCSYFSRLSDRGQKEMWMDMISSFYGIGSGMMVISLICITLYFITSADSGSLVVDCLASNGSELSPPLQKTYWAITVGAAAHAMLVVGDNSKDSLSALQSASICAGLPYTIMMCFLCVALWRACALEMGDVLWKKNRFWRQDLMEVIDCRFEKSYFKTFGRVCLAIFAPTWFLRSSLPHSGMKKVSERFMLLGFITFLFYLTFICIIINYVSEPDTTGVWVFGLISYVFFGAGIASFRSMMRSKHNIDGNFVEDLLAGVFLYPLACEQIDVHFRSLSMGKVVNEDRDPIQNSTLGEVPVAKSTSALREVPVAKSTSVAKSSEVAVAESSEVAVAESSEVAVAESSEVAVAESSEPSPEE